jgi:hypothetical protein
MAVEMPHRMDVWMEFYGTWFAGSADRAARAVLVVNEAAESADQGKSALTAWDRLRLLAPMLATVLFAEGPSGTSQADRCPVTDRLSGRVCRAAQ